MCSWPLDHYCPAGVLRSGNQGCMCFFPLGAEQADAFAWFKLVFVFAETEHARASRLEAGRASDCRQRWWGHLARVSCTGQHASRL